MMTIPMVSSYQIQLTPWQQSMIFLRRCKFVLLHWAYLKSRPILLFLMISGFHVSTILFIIQNNAYSHTLMNDTMKPKLYKMNYATTLGNRLNTYSTSKTAICIRFFFMAGTIVHVMHCHEIFSSNPSV